MSVRLFIFYDRVKGIIMSLTAWCLDAQSYKDDDYGYVNIATTWTGKDMPSKPLTEKKLRQCGHMVVSMELSALDPK